VTGLSLNGARVLIVEDNYVVASALRYLLESYGGAVSAVVPSVARAREALADGGVDIAVLDINLHGASVVPLAQHLREQGVPFVFLTGYADGELLPEDLRQHPRFGKPVEAERLIGAMLALIGRG
jgi:CheY-like chemotaxis protein